MPRKHYASDLTDSQWALLEPLIPAAKHGGRPRTANPREVLSAIFYVLKTGCQWSYLPEGFPPRSTVHEYFKRWQDDGTLGAINKTLRGKVRQMAARHPDPSRAIIDAQSVKTTDVGGEKKRVRRGQKGKGKEAPHHG